MYSAEGTLIQRLPTDFPGETKTVESALKCPYPTQETVTPPCTSEVDDSEDLSHFVFSSNTTSFSDQGGSNESSRIRLRRRRCHRHRRS